MALNAANHDAREAFTPLFTALLRVLPIDPPEGAPENVPKPIIRGHPLGTENESDAIAIFECLKAFATDLNVLVLRLKSTRSDFEPITYKDDRRYLKQKK